MKRSSNWIIYNYTACLRHENTEETESCSGISSFCIQVVSNWAQLPVMIVWKCENPAWSTKEHINNNVLMRRWWCLFSVTSMLLLCFSHVGLWWQKTGKIFQEIWKDLLWFFLHVKRTGNILKLNTEALILYLTVKPFVESQEVICVWD